MNNRKSKIRRMRGGSLLIVSLLLIGSATLRVGVQAGTSFVLPPPEAPGQTPIPDQVVTQIETTPAGLQRLISVLRNREQQQNRRELQIQDRMKALEIADDAINRKLVALVDAEERLSATLAMADGASEEDLSRLTDVYEKMKPKDAAALFEEMAPEFAAGFLGRMRPTSAANIMAGLNPQTAYTISVILAGRNAWVPKE